jgi:hypothetical protein
MAVQREGSEGAGKLQTALSTYPSFLNELLDTSFQERQRQNVDVRMKLAHLPCSSHFEYV